MAKRDKIDYADIRQLTDMVEEAYHTRGKAVRQVSQRSGWTDDHIDYDKLHVKRRVSATIKTTPALMTRVASICPNIPDVYFCEEEWASINASTFYSYDNMEDDDTLSLAVTMWMLDRMKESDRLHEAIQLLPEDDGTLDDIYLPDVWDVCHSDQMLRGMMYAVQQRNADCSAMKKRSHKQSESKAQHDRFFMDEYTTAGIHHQQVPSRQRFEALIELIPQSAVDQAVKRCEDKMWEWAERYFRCRAILTREENDLDAKTETFYREANTTIRELRSRRDKFEATIKSKGPVMPPVLERPKIDLLKPLRYQPTYDTFDALDYMNRAKAEEERLEKARDALSDRIQDFQLAVQPANTSPHRVSLHDFGEEFATIMGEFSIDEPYEICFGMLYLIDQGSDLPWLYLLGLSVLHQARIRLPWHIGEYDEEDDLVWNGVGDYTDERHMEDSTADLPSGIAVPEMPDWYSLDYVDRGQNPLFQFNVNMAQIFYGLTGVIVPRNLERYYPTLRNLARYGIKGKKTTLPLLYCMTLAGEAKRRSPNVRWPVSDRDLDEDTEEDISVVGAEEPETLTAEQMQAELMALKKNNERLTHALHKADRDIRDATKQNEALEKTFESQRQELSDLRALIFNRDEGAFEEDSPPDPSIIFPYEARHRMLVFGGHDSWTKEMKPRLPDVRFIGKDVVPDVNLLRNADIIWIQTNCISHRQYYKIMRIVRGRDIPVRYFSFASAAKCAEQVVHEDMK